MKIETCLKDSLGNTWNFMTFEIEDDSEKMDQQLSEILNMYKRQIDQFKSTIPTIAGVSLVQPPTVDIKMKADDE